MDCLPGRIVVTRHSDEATLHQYSRRRLQRSLLNRFGDRRMTRPSSLIQPAGQDCHGLLGRPHQHHITCQVCDPPGAGLRGQEIYPQQGGIGSKVHLMLENAGTYWQPFYALQTRLYPLELTCHSSSEAVPPVLPSIALGQFILHCVIGLHSCFAVFFIEVELWRCQSQLWLLLLLFKRIISASTSCRLSRSAAPLRRGGNIDRFPLDLHFFAGGSLLLVLLTWKFPQLCQLAVVHDPQRLLVCQ